MSDAQLRELERRFRASGNREDETAWIAARIRAGELSRTGLELAAWCGHEAARATLAEPVGVLEIGEEWLTLGPAMPDDPGCVALPAWLQRLEQLGGLNAILRAAAALYHRSPNTQGAGLLLSSGQTVHPERDTAFAVEDWILGARSDAALARFKRAIGLDAATARMMARCVCSVGATQPMSSAQAARELRSVLPFLRLDSASATDAVRSELVPWALGYGDPVRARVGARASS